MMTIIEILNKAVQHGASDVLITTGSPPVARINGSLVALDREALDGNDTEKYARDLTTATEFKKFNEERELDIAFQTISAGRFRVNMFFQQGNPAIVMRSIKTEIPTFDQIKLPEVCRELTQKKRGMILVTGPTGSGKSTTLAAMINEINNTRNEHIITIEDPTEYVHKHRKSIISQREVGKDTFSFERALRAALREDPDIILVGEMRDLETISIASTAAETGHLLFSTLHTIGAAKTIDRIIDVFPPHGQAQIRTQLSEVLQAVISQQLIPTVDGKGRIAVHEVMIANSAIKNLIREGKTYQMHSVIQTNRNLGMQTMDDSILEAYRKGIITKDNAIKYAVDMDYVREQVEK